MITVSHAVIAASTMVDTSRLDMQADVEVLPKSKSGDKKRKKKKDPLEKLLSDELLLDSDDEEKASDMGSLSPGAGAVTPSKSSLFTKKASTDEKPSSALSSKLKVSAPATATMPSRGGDELAEDAFIESMGGFGRGGRQAVGKPGAAEKPAELDYSSDDSDIAMFSADKVPSATDSARSPASAGGAKIKAYFEEYLDAPLLVEVASSAMTIGAFIEECIEAWNRKHEGKPLKGHKGEHYSAYSMDDDEIDKDSSPFSNELAVLGLGEKKLGLVANDKAVARGGGVSAADAERQRLKRLQSIKKTASTFIRVKVPGPGARTLTLSFDSDQVQMPMRDLYFELNRKRQEVHFHATYFELFYDGGESLKGAEPLSNALKISDLKSQNLIVLPKYISESDERFSDAITYPLVKLAYQSQTWKANKIRSGKKLGRSLGVDYYKITREAIEAVTTGLATAASGVAEDGAKKGKGGFFAGLTGKLKSSAEHLPIDINDVVAVSVQAEDAKQFKLSYKHVKHGITTHYYEMPSSAECKEFVDKVSFLCELHRLRG